MRIYPAQVNHCTIQLAVRHPLADMTGAVCWAMSPSGSTFLNFACELRTDCRAWIKARHMRVIEMCAKDLSKPEHSSETEGFFAELVMRHSSDGVIISGPDRKALWVNPAFTQQTGYLIDDLLGKEPGSVLQGPETDPTAAEKITHACQRRREVRLDILNYTRTGQPFWVDLKVTPVYDSTGRHTHFISTMRDISERKALEQQNDEMRHSEDLRQSERQLMALTSEWLYSAKSFQELLMVVKRAIHTLIPEADGALYIFDDSRTVLELATTWGTIPEFERHILPDDCWALRRGRAYAYGLKPIEFACDHVHKKGTPYFCLPIVAQGETIGLMHIIFDGFEEGGLMRHMRDGVLRNRWDISLICAEQISLAVANVRLRQELQDKSVRDPLTGLWNRRWFMERAPRELVIAQRAAEPVALVSLDVDHFKKFNDEYGHDIGDLVLCEVGRTLTDFASDQVYACRLGGEEFMLICLGQTMAQARTLANDVRLAVKSLHLKSGTGATVPPITISGGVATTETDGWKIETLMKAADLALYQAKAKGRDQIVAAPTCADTSSDKRM